MSKKFKPKFTGFSCNPSKTESQYNIEGNVCTVHFKFKTGRSNKLSMHIPSVAYGSKFYYLNPKPKKQPRTTFKTPKGFIKKPTKKRKLKLPKYKVKVAGYSTHTYIFTYK